MPALRLRWSSLFLPLGLFALIASVIVALRSPKLPFRAQTTNNPPDVILDDARSFVSNLGTWTTESVGYLGSQRVHDYGPQDWNRPLEYGGFSTTIYTPGQYGMYVTWSPSSTFSGEVTLSIHRSYGYVGSPSDDTAWTRLTLNQRSLPANSWTCDGIRWQYIGNIQVDSSYRYVGAFFSAGNGAPRNARFGVDAVMFVPSSRQPFCASSSSSASLGSSAQSVSSHSVSSQLSSAPHCVSTILPSTPNPSWMAIQDFNNDGKKDIAALSVYSPSTANNQLNIFLNNGNGTFGPRMNFGGSMYQGIAAGDFDQDGFADLALTVNNGSLAVLHNDKTGRFPAVPEIVSFSPALSVPEQIAVGDVNHDGDMDLLVGSLYEGAEVLYGASGLRFTPGPKLGETGGNTLNPRLVDVNADGYLDAVTTPAGPNGPRMTVYLNDRTGHFDGGTSYDSTGNPYTRNLHVGDVNGDARPDLVQATNHNTEVIVWRNTGNGRFERASTLVANGGAMDGALADFDRDGKTDLIEGTYVRNFFFHRGNGDGTFAEGQSIPLPVAGRQMEAADFDRDGIPDFAMVLAENRAGVLVFLSDGSCLTAGPSSSASSASLVSSVSSASSASQGPGCTDSDGGMAYTVPGTITNFLHGNSVVPSFGDVCFKDNNANPAIDPNILLEGYCGGDGYGHLEQYRCPFGCQNSVCLDGSSSTSSSRSSVSSAPAQVCGNGRIETPNENCDDGNSRDGDGCSALCRFECSDSDLADDPAVRGEVRSHYCSAGGQSCEETVEQDSCLPGNARLIAQYSCSTTSPFFGAISVRTELCPGSQICQDGVCGYGAASSSSSSSSASVARCGNGVIEGNEQCEVGYACPTVNCIQAPCPQPRCDGATCRCVACPNPTPPACPGGVLFPQLGPDENGCALPPVCCEGAANGGQCTTNMRCTNGRCLVESCSCGIECAAPVPPACPGGVLFPQLGPDENGCALPPVCCEGAANGGQCTTNMRCTNGRCLVESCSCGNSSASVTYRECAGPNGTLIAVPTDQPCPST